MADILHRLHVAAPPSEVFRALVEHDLLGRAWGHVVLHAEPGARLAWRCVDGPTEWLGTEITFELQPYGGGTIVRFGHRHWRAPTDTMAECATRWAHVLFQLKSWVETPEADDLHAG
jgi:uncharacterized protein YndB with AHSA1/START domain